MNMWDGLIEEIRNQQACLDQLIAAWKSDYTAAGGTIHCGRGCRECCNLAVNATLTEAVAIAGALTEVQAEALQRYVGHLLEAVGRVGDIKGYLRMHRQELGYCPLLDDEGACGIYGVRPLSCRALLSTMPSRWCTVDFSALSAGEKQNFMEGLDRGAVAFPSHYAAFSRDTGQELEARAGRLMSEKFGFSIYGSMPVLVDLVRRHGLAETCGHGYDATIALLSATGADHPFLLQVER
ncbi:YkgJ family cysteine cluster protein [Geobacter sp. SVR]|uniref:YkgJ family cysteine cluster protein n=1 Tax=Geobacter sp. SVR TaxID=2495594 RepID=UPI00143EF911|nr:YkgJ family cysteine cluster protein [Geobacter sp. SVR]BCS53406.1 zinc/iron-chelating domain-containing protein [Geobacter sp. SVR]GCF85468.1 zinc/iron-chelating domain-containing protein [Geobacter sp. SVR]